MSSDDFRHLTRYKEYIMKNLVLIAIYMFGANAFAMSPVESRKEMIVTQKIGTESVCLEIASLTESKIRSKLVLNNDANFSLKCLPYKNLNDTYALVADVTKNTKKIELKLFFLKRP